MTVIKITQNENNYYKLQVKYLRWIQNPSFFPLCYSNTFGQISSANHQNKTNYLAFFITVKTVQGLHMHDFNNTTEMQGAKTEVAKESE